MLLAVVHTVPQRPRLFDDSSQEDGDDPAYLACRNHQLKREVREALEDVWQRHGGLCAESPEQFLRQFRRDFHARAWELWLIGAFSAKGFTLERPPQHGPDVCLRLPTGRRCWIEATSPGPGVGPDAVFQRPPGRWHGSLYSEESLILRYRQALEEKLGKLDEYCRLGIISRADIALIAVYQGKILDSDMHDFEIPLLVKSVFPIGRSGMAITPYSSEPPRPIVLPRDSVTKRNGSTVLTNLFLDERSAVVSGILAVSSAIWNLRWSPEDVLNLLHNPLGSNPMPRSTLPLRCEMWVEGELLRHRGRCGQYGPFAS